MSVDCLHCGTPVELHTECVLFTGGVTHVYCKKPFLAKLRGYSNPCYACNTDGTMVSTVTNEHSECTNCFGRGYTE